MKPNESDLLLLRNYVKDAPSQYSRVATAATRAIATSEPTHLICITSEQRNLIVRALDCLRDVNRQAHG